MQREIFPLANWAAYGSYASSPKWKKLNWIQNEFVRMLVVNLEIKGWESLDFYTSLEMEGGRIFFKEQKYLEGLDGSTF